MAWNQPYSYMYVKAFLSWRHNLCIGQPNSVQQHFVAITTLSWHFKDYKQLSQLKRRDNFPTSQKHLASFLYFLHFLFKRIKEISGRNCVETSIPKNQLRFLVSIGKDPSAEEIGDPIRSKRKCLPRLLSWGPISARRSTKGLPASKESWVLPLTKFKIRLSPPPALRLSNSSPWSVHLSGIEWVTFAHNHSILPVFANGDGRLTWIRSIEPSLSKRCLTWELHSPRIQDGYRLSAHCQSDVRCWTR